MNMRSFEPIMPNDKVIMSLSPHQMEALQNVQDQYEKSAQLKRYAHRAFNKFYAMQVLFWDDIMNSNERCETADNRGKMLSICLSDDDELVIVERMKPDNLEDIFED